jgi:hypothetical protein
MFSLCVISILPLLFKGGFYVCFQSLQHKYDVLTFHLDLHNQIKFALVGANLMKCTN